MDTDRPKSKRPIPPDAKLAFKGVIFDIYQWEQELYDGSKAIFEKIKRFDGVNVLPVTEDGKIILTEQEQPGYSPFWASIGGRMEEGESPIECAKRELLEESGFAAEEFTLWNAVQPSLMADWAIYCFIAKRAKKISVPTPDAGEKIELHFLSLDEFIERVKDPEFRDREIALHALRTLAESGGYEKLQTLFSPKV